MSTEKRGHLIVQSERGSRGVESVRACVRARVRACVRGGGFVVVYYLIKEHDLGSHIHFLWRSFLTGNTTGVTKLTKQLKMHGK